MKNAVTPASPSTTESKKVPETRLIRGDQPRTRLSTKVSMETTRRVLLCHSSVEIASTRTLNRWPRNSGLAAISRMAIPSAYSFLWLRGIANSSGLQPGNERTVPAVGIYATGLPAPIRRSPQQGGRGIGAPQGLSWLVACLE